MKRISDDELVSGILSGTPKAKEQMYLQYRDECMAWICKTFSDIDRDCACDVYMDACVAAWDKIHGGKYVLRPEVSFKTYLFSIVRNMILNILRGEKKKSLHHVTDKMPDELVVDNDGEDVKRKREMIVRDTIFNIVNEPCRSIFRYRYYENMSCEDIAVKMSYAGARVVITLSSRCHKKLRILLSDTFKKAGLL